MMIPTKELKQILQYDEYTGTFTWKKKVSNRTIIGGKAGTVSNGYLRISIHSFDYYAHKLAWAYMTGKWPELRIDHIDGNPSNNAWLNLRLVTHSENLCNSKIHSNNKSGVKGVCFHKKTKKWMAQLRHKGIHYHIGYFSDISSAAVAVRAARIKLHGNFARHE